METRKPSFEVVSGQDVLPFIPDLARLRIEVFREYPYLYDGDMAYEEKYLRNYAQSPESVFVLARDGDDIIGVSTGVPLPDETDYIQRPFLERGFDPATIFYYGESVLRKSYRGRGIGRRFMAEREAYARNLGRFAHVAFCAVERPADHPARPTDYVPLDAFWAKRGFTKHPTLHTSFSWREIGEDQESAKPMVFWLKALEPAN